jgi:hypothetical protein
MKRLEDGAYDPETVNLLREVLDETWEELSPKQKARTQKSDIALRILRLAMRGERDPVRLRIGAVTEIVADNTIASVDQPDSDNRRPPAPSVRLESGKGSQKGQG